MKKHLRKQMSSKPRYVACLKYGKKYDPEYVNKLYDMVKRNLTLNFNFVCFTEDPQGINKEIQIKPLPLNKNVQGWWYKPFFFDPNLGIDGTVLFLDLDMIIFRNIDNLFSYKPGEFCIIRDFNRCRVPSYDKFNSSVFRLDTGQHSHVYYDFIKDPRMISRRFQGDQDWIRHTIKDGFHYWPEEWIMSYKWEMRDRPRMVLDPRGGRNFAETGEPKIKPATSIAVFHGDPNPHKCNDPWVKNHWK